MTEFINPITGGRDVDTTQTLQSSAVALGNGGNMFVRNRQSALLNVSGITSATILVEGTLDNTNWFTLSVKKSDTGVSGNSIIADGLYIVNFLGLLNIRARISTYVSGTINVLGVNIPLSLSGGSSGGSGGAVTEADGANVAIGATTDVAVITDDNGTISAKLRGIIKLILAKIGVTAADGDISTLGITTGAAIVTDTTGTVQRYLRGLVKLLANIVIDATYGVAADIKRIAAGENHLGEVGGKTILATVELTRGTATTAYASNQTVLNSAGTLTEITAVSRIVGGSGYIAGIRVLTNAKSITPRFRLHFFNVSNPTFPADYASWKDLYADASKRVGYYDMPAMITAADATNSDCSRALDFTMRIPFSCAAGATSLFYAIETLDAFTPTNGQKITLTLNVEQN